MFEAETACSRASQQFSPFMLFTQAKSMCQAELGTKLQTVGGFPAPQGTGWEGRPWRAFAEGPGQVGSMD